VLTTVKLRNDIAIVYVFGTCEKRGKLLRKQEMRFSIATVQVLFVFIKESNQIIRYTHAISKNVTKCSAFLIGKQILVMNINKMIEC
jgi:hypothetical protein